MAQQTKIEPNNLKKQPYQRFMNPQQSANRSKHMQSLLKTPQYAYVLKSLIFLQSYTTEEILNELYLSFNGGKDATIVLYLFKMAIQKKNKQSSDYKGAQTPLKCLYFSEPNPFEEVDNFKDFIIKQNKLIMNELATKKYAKQLTLFAQNNKLRYVIMGSRKDDPYCQNLGMLAKSDTHKGYPDFIRLNPIIQWSHDQVWKFILNFSIPYCSLYKQGYTYLGNKDNTIRNTNLYDSSVKAYKPAHQAPNEMEKQSRSIDYGLKQGDIK